MLAEGRRGLNYKLLVHWGCFKSMAVYTKIDQDELEHLLTGLGIGRLRAYSGVADGLENSTYFVTAEQSTGGTKDWVLTVLETTKPEQTSFSVALVEQLASADLPVPAFVKDQAGNAIHQIAGKQALLAERAIGTHPSYGGSSVNVNSVNIKKCAAIGNFLGSMHRLSTNFEPHLVNPYGQAWANSALASLGAYLSADQKALINEQLSRQETLVTQSASLPVGAIHADLFRDNTLFDGDRLCAVIDFHSACTDCLLLDVAVAVNDWASTAEGELDVTLARALISAYAQQRSFVEQEYTVWQEVLAKAATQFWMSRLLTQQSSLEPGSDSTTELTGRTGKDPEQYARILRCRLKGTVALSDLT